MVKGIPLYFSTLRYTQIERCRKSDPIAAIKFNYSLMLLITCGENDENIDYWSDGFRRQGSRE
ncbi:hypothetical protein BML2537_29100 [Providencia stuartii]|nr:hypothetical protein BML2537_29100 [Providencia stuartii]GHB82432.1 hypothetical protein GCM10007290_02830 [Providencia thailandensis]